MECRKINIKSSQIKILMVIMLIKAEGLQPWKKGFENDTKINFHNVCCLSLYDGILHILQNVMKSDLINCN